MLKNFLLIVLVYASCEWLHTTCWDPGEKPIEEKDMADSDTLKRIVQKSDCLCEGEKEFVHQRRMKILDSLKKHNIKCELEDVPNIALVVSGGGQRAAVGMLGSIHQMEQDALMDTVLYMGGVSGSTWSMASLYKEPKWNVSSVIATQRGPKVELEEVSDWLMERGKEQNFSLSHLWGALTSSAVMKEMITNKFSEQATREALNPYPVYCAIDKQCFQDGHVEATWFEMTPHRCGFTDLGFYVDTPYLGSRFDSGGLVEQREEMDMTTLQGILGSALAEDQTIKDMMPDWMTENGGDLHAYFQAYQLLHTMVNQKDNEDGNSSLRTDLEKVLEDAIKKKPQESSATAEEKKVISEQWGLDFIKVLGVWCEGLQESPFKRLVCWMINHVFPLVVKWEWGSINNFLYKHSDPKVPSNLRTRKTLQLIDAGLMINAPYPSFLGPKRGVDLMIVLEYSGGNIFETLELAQNYSRKMNKPFPQFNHSVLEEREQPEDFYVFEGQEGEPTILYMPLFNLQNCQDKDDIAKEREEYTTFQPPYSAEKIDYLVEKAKVNIRNNKQKILQQIEKAVQRKQQLRNSDSDEGMKCVML
ncbi:cytosolic phospholipase A2 gamma-like [Hypomesus transpacificus]|uniref:cytosolic phospholipase A2 gamma-like n=1 Tax=Hypomesus transpacificus TaxID=137520 RepID=UPI001F080A7D|nr:cytosolic phospholipase A2 gamma-like [Hypomesus transpacificus]